jgi:hypothetical protein
MLKRFAFAFLALLLISSMTVAQDPDVDFAAPVCFTDHYSSAMIASPVMDFEIVYTPGPDEAAVDRWRYAVVEAVAPGYGISISTEYYYDAYGGADLVGFDEPVWSEWAVWDDPGGAQAFRVDGLVEAPLGEPLVYYLLAVQVKDANGSRSSELSYAGEVQNFRVSSARTPALTVSEPTFGESPQFTGIHSVVREDIAMGQELIFEWFATADAYCGAIESYRWGWDLLDPEDPMDPGWAVEHGSDPGHMETGVTTFDTGIHVLTIECLDIAGLLTRVQYELSVVPVPDLADRLPLLLVDDVHDRSSQAWTVGDDALDDDPYRDAFWAETLSAVEGWDAARDVIDTQDDQNWGLREAVQYKTIVWTTRKGLETYIDNQFVMPTPSRAHVWLESFVQDVGNLFLVGSSALQNFTSRSGTGVDWLYPLIYDTDETYVDIGIYTYALGYGLYPDPDGGDVVVGTQVFPCCSFGVAMTNLAAPPNFWLADGVVGTRSVNVRNRCSGTKAVIMDPGFTAQHGWAYGLADTVYTAAHIDAADDPDDLGLNWIFGSNDEFYDANVTTRPTAWAPQTLPDGSPAVEAMWRAYTRYDWILDVQHASGNTDFPAGIYIASPEYCGDWAVDPATGRTRNDGVPLGVLSRKTEDCKPSACPDVLWGFDPYRFDNGDMTLAIRHVLKGNFGLEVDGIVANEPDKPIAPPPTRTMLHPCRPNPFNPSTTVMLETAAPGMVSLRVVDVRGRHVRTLLDEAKGVGVFEAVWNGRDDAGRSMPAGTYFVQMITEDVRETRRAVLLK